MGSVQDVQAVLLNSVSMDERTRRLAFQTSVDLQENEPRILPLLLSIYTDPSAGSQVRFLAICFAKNVAARLYPKISDLSIREHIKSVLVNAISSPAEFLKELVLLLRRVARFEFPNNWPQLVDFVRSYTFNDQSAYIMYQLVKEQESKKLMAGRKESLEIAPVLLQSLLPIWLSTSHSEQSESLRFIDGAVMRLCQMGYLRLYEQEALATSVTALALQKLTILLEKPDCSDRFVTKLLKEISQLYESQILAFTLVGIDHLLRVCLVCIERKTGREFPINILTHTFSSTFCKGGKFESQSDDAKWILLANKCREQIATFLNSQKSITETTAAAVRRCLCLGRDDVAEWLSSPDESIGGPLDGDDLRSAGELLVVSIGVGSAWSENIVRFCLEKIDSQIKNPPPDLLDIDSWVSVLILCNVAVQEFFDFNSIMAPLIQVLSVSSSDPATLLLQFRIIQLIRVGSVKGVSPGLIELLVSCLGPQKPTVIRLAATNALKSIYDRTSDLPVWDSFRAPIIETAVDLLRCVSAVDVVWRLLNIVTLMASSSSENVDIPESTLSSVSDLFYRSDDLIKFAIFDLLKSILAKSKFSIKIVELCLGIVDLTLRTVEQNIAAQSTESMTEAAAGLFSAIVRVADPEILPHLEPYIARMVDAACALMGEEIFVDEIVTCLIDWNCAIAISRPDLVRSLQLAAQTNLVGDYLKADLLESTADECLVLLETIVSISNSDPQVSAVVSPIIQYISLTVVAYDDSCPLPMDGLMDLVCTVAKSRPEQYLGTIAEMNIMVENLSIRLSRTRTSAKKLRLLYALALCVPSFLRSGGSPQIISQMRSAWQDTETSRELESMHSASRSNKISRFDSSSGSPAPVARDALISQIRTVEVASIRAILDRF